MFEVEIQLPKTANSDERPVFVKTLNSRYRKELYSYSRLVDASANFCLCTYCSKTDIVNGKICDNHDKFMRMTQEMEIAAPVFACSDFVELEGVYNHLNDYYDNGVLSPDVLKARIPEVTERVKEQWKAQEALWKREHNNQETP